MRASWRLAETAAMPSAISQTTNTWECDDMRVDNQTTRNARVQRNSEINREQVRKLLAAAQDYFGKKPSPDENTNVPYQHSLSRWKHYSNCQGRLRTNYDTGELFTAGQCDCTVGKLIDAIEAITGEWE